MTKKSLHQILTPVLDIISLVYSQPDLFNLSGLGIDDKLTLAKDDPNFFIDKLGFDKLNIYDKSFVLLHSRNKKILNKVSIPESDYKKLSDETYAQLLEKDFDKYISKERFDLLTNAYQNRVFLNNPEWVMLNAGEIPKLTRDNLSALADNNRAFVDTYIKEFTGLCTDAYFWIDMIKHNWCYASIFLKNTKYVATKTDVRVVFREYPLLIKEIDKDIIANSKLSIKEWILMMDSVIENNKDKFKDWNFSDDLIEIFRLDLMAELLNGKSKLSKRFQNAMKNVFDENE